jgi:type 1 glutamine amidotransferase
MNGVPRFLIFTKTAGFRHDTVDVAVGALRGLAKDRGWHVEASEDSGVFNAETLAGFAATVWFNTTGSLLSNAERTAFERFVREGGGYVGLHAASSTGYDWPFYAALVGALFDGHPPPQSATLRVTDAAHPATAHLDRSFSWVDEWYNFREPPRDVRALLEVDESSYTGGTLGASHPIAWCHEAFGGRAFYTALGHHAAAYSDPRLLGHIGGGMAWAARVENRARVPAEGSAPHNDAAPTQTR